MSELPVAAYALPGISPRAYQHPADRAATAALQRIPYLDQVVRRLVALGYERALRTSILGNGVRLGQHQLPDVWVLHRQVVHSLDLADVPDLYLTQHPLANASTFGSKRPVVVLHSQLVELLPQDGLRAVLAHEAAHIHADHVLYATALEILTRLTVPAAVGVLAGLPLMAIKLALLEWMRAAELTCDRGAAILTRDPQAVCRALLAIAGGAAVDRLSLDAFIAQGMEYDTGATGFERISRLLADLGVTHPLPVRRTRELMLWVRSGDFDRIAGGDYPKRDDPVSPRAEAGDAVSFYTDRFKDAFRDAGETIGQGGQQIADWLRKTKDGLGGDASA
jgi:Zn-dependent protease with chaperone function